MSPKTCPTSETLLAYLLGNLDELSSDSILEHIEQCQKCEDTAASFDTESDSVLAGLREKVVASPYADESDYVHALSLVKAIGHDPTLAGTPAVSSVPGESPDLGSLRDYRLLSKLGEGGMGTVYKALHTKLDKIMALKVLPTDKLKDEHAITRFQREMKAVGKLEHPNIVRATDAGEVDGKHFLVMELVEGLDLSTIVHSIGPLPVADACEVVRQAAIGLQHAHEHGLVHRDIKPSNLMLNVGGSLREPNNRSRSERPTIKILDMGLARLALLEEQRLPVA